MQNSAIEWTDTTWNPVYGCTPVSDGCRNCYAATISHRFSKVKGPYFGLADFRQGRAVFNGTIRLREDKLTEPLHWREPRRVFVNSMSDLFHESVPFEFVDKVFAIMALCPRHTFQVLTKRPERMAEYFRRVEEGFTTQLRIGLEALGYTLDSHYENPESTVGVGVKLVKDGGLQCWPLPNVWLGTSVEHQKAADERIPHLLRCPAAVRFLSCEPLLGLVDLYWAAKPDRETSNISCRDVGDILIRGIHWVIVGGESGRGARPMHPSWAHGLRDSCEMLGIPFFFKQWGEWCPSDQRLDLDHAFMKSGSVLDTEPSLDSDTGSRRYGKKACGRMLDGMEWNEFPRVGSHAVV